MLPHGRPGFDPWGREVPLEKEMATRSSILAWRIPWMEQPGGLQSMGSQSRTRLSELTSLHFTSLHEVVMRIKRFHRCHSGWYLPQNKLLMMFPLPTSDDVHEGMKSEVQ